MCWNGQSRIKNCISSGCHQSRQPKARSTEASSNFENEINSQDIYFLASQSIRLFCRKATNQWSNNKK
jgi:hypothetical protein